MIVTTSHSIEGHTITDYIRVVAGETITGINLVKDFTAGIRDIIGGRSNSYEREVIAARENALGEMVDRAIELGADGIVGVHLDYQSLGSSTMILVAATGTAVKFA